MTFVKGVTTWGALASKLTALACGEVADDFGITVETASQWRRQTAGQPVIAAPASKEVTIQQEHRAGYWDRSDDTGMYTDAQPTAGAFFKTTNIITSSSGGLWGSSNKKRLFANITIVTVNTTANDYSTLVASLKVIGYDNTTYTMIVQNNIAFAADGTGNFSVSTGGVSWTFSYSVGSPTGFVPLVATFQRDFTPEYPGGIDAWNGFGKAFGTATFSVAPSGVAGTDYDIIKTQGAVNNININTYYTPIGVRPVISRGNGLGIKTQAALNGNRYALSFGLTEAIGAFLYNIPNVYIPSVTANGNQIQFAWGGTSVDSDGFRSYGNGGSTQIAPFGFVQPFTQATASPTAALEYWMSVTPSHITLAVNGDVAATGVFSINQIAEITPPIGDTVLLNNWYIGILTPGLQRNYYRLGRHPLIDAYSVKGFRDGGRDWQTGFGRSDFYYNSGEIYYSGFTGEMLPNNNQSCLEDQYSYGYFSDPISQITNRNIINYVTGDWNLSGLSLLSHRYGTNSTEPLPGIMRPGGTVSHGLLKVPSGGFASGDELTDSATGKKYMLWVCDNSALVGIAGYPWGIAQEEV